MGSLTAQDQDRPYGMVNADGKLYIGTMAGYGKLEGALSVYDPETGGCTTWKSPVPEQSIVSLAYLDGKVTAERRSGLASASNPPRPRPSCSSTTRRPAPTRPSTCPAGACVPPSR